MRGEAASRSHRGCRTRAPCPGRAARKRGETSRRPSRCRAGSGPRRLTRRAAYSCKYLQQRALVSFLYGPDPFGSIDQVEDMDRQNAVRRVEIRPQGSGRGRDDAGERGKPIGIAKFERYFDEPGSPSSSTETEHDARNGDVGEQDIFQNGSAQAADDTGPP